MIQVSSPIEAQSPPPEHVIIQGGSGESHSLWGQKAQKKNKPGIFAKLLEGLTAKVNPASGNTKEALKPGNTEIHPEKTGKNSFRAALDKKTPEPEFISKNDTLGTFQAIFNQNSLTGELNQNIKTGAGISRFDGKEGKSSFAGKDQFRAGENSLKQMARNEEESLLFARNRTGGTEREIQDTALNASTNRTGKAASGSAGIPGGEKAKNAGPGNGTPDILSFSFREMEAEFLQAHLRSGQLRTDADRDNSRLSEFRGKKGRERPAIEVRDLRTGEVKNAGSMEISKGNMFSFSRPVISEIELPVDLNLSPGRGDGSQAAKTAKETSAGFEDALARELRGNLSADIVRDATVIVRNGGEGTIRLSLRPASLGDVKIRLEMTENKITGHIIVESSEALRAFERELPVLEKAFKDSGFSETNLEMSLAQDGGNYGAGEQRQEGEFQSYTPVQAASLYEAETDWMDASSGSRPVQDGMVLPAGSPGSPGLRPQVNLLI